MNELITSPLMLLPAVLVAAAVLHAMVRRTRRRRQERREQGWRLIHELKAYSAWIDSRRGEPYTSAPPDELTAAEPLRNARAIVRQHFPQLGQGVLRLLRADSRLMRYLWEQKLLRLSDPAAWVAPQRDPTYIRLRDAQDELIDELITQCQVLTGERQQPWRSTHVDPEFFASMSVTTSRPSR